MPPVNAPKMHQFPTAIPQFANSAMRYSTPYTGLRGSVDNVLIGGMFPRNCASVAEEHLIPKIPTSCLTTLTSNKIDSPLVEAKSNPPSSNGSSIGPPSAESSLNKGVLTLAPPAPQREPANSNFLIIHNAMVANQKKPHVTVVFDLDETLCSNRRVGKAILRPGAIEILKFLSQLSNDVSVNCHVEVLLWTASTECVARPVVDRLDPNGTCFAHLIYRDRRWYKEVGYTKDLTKLGRDMDRVIIVENSHESVRMNRKNAIIVKDFIGTNPHDQDLFVVKDVLESWIRLCGTKGNEINPIQQFLTQHPHLGDRNEVICKAGGPGTVGANRSYFLTSGGTGAPSTPPSPISNYSAGAARATFSRGYGALRK